ncbi:MAG: hypothetical protein NTW59_01180, partial [Candidatus Diapherotrites archaeon]|nr:hypothetical protein [Candidatus Diapherotrites archaeon]
MENDDPKFAPVEGAKALDKKQIREAHEKGATPAEADVKLKEKEIKEKPEEPTWKKEIAELKETLQR